MKLIDADKLPHYDGTALSAAAVASAVENAPTIDVESLITQHEDIGYERGYRDGYAEAWEVLDDAEPVEFEWCHDCKEYDQNAHCCHRWTKVIRTTVNDLKTQGYEPVKHGKWIENKGGFGWYCSECKKYDYYAYCWSSENEKYELQDTYCPNCGSKMDVPDTDVGKMEDKDEEIF